MKTASWVAFCLITASDFFNISKLRGAHEKGGGQSYIDLAGIGIDRNLWPQFFDRAVSYSQKQGPAWEVPVHSLGMSGFQTVKIASRTNPDGQFRNMSIREQKIHSSKGNRIKAWDPRHTSFPDLPSGINKADPSLEAITENLVVYLVKSTDGQYWAGWFQAERPEPTWACDPQLLPLFSGGEGLIKLSPEVPFDENNAEWPFQLPAGAGAAPASATPIARTVPPTAKPPAAAIPPSSSPARAAPKTPSTAPESPANKSARKPKEEVNEDELAEALFNGDLDDETPDVKERMQKVVARNQKAAKLLKDLYKKCQITGEQFLFTKANGKPYTEAHHLVPLGKGGADSPHNLVVVSAHIHRMLHYAVVTGLDLSKIKDGKLPIKINGTEYTITWHPSHIRVVESAQATAETTEPDG